MKNIEDVICPNNGQLKMKGEKITAQIVDAELDVYKCNFNNDDCVEINTKKYNSIVLSIENLYELIDLIEQAQEKYQDFFNNENLENDK